MNTSTYRQVGCDLWGLGPQNWAYIHSPMTKTPTMSMAHWHILSEIERRMTGTSMCTNVFELCLGLVFKYYWKLRDIYDMSLFFHFHHSNKIHKPPNLQVTNKTIVFFVLIRALSKIIPKIQTLAFSISSKYHQHQRNQLSDKIDWIWPS